MVSYAFIATAAVGFIAEKQREAMSLKEKIYLIGVYLLHTGVCLYTTCALFALSLDNPISLPLASYFAFMTIKVAVLFVGVTIIDRSSLSWTSLIMLLMANVNLPITLSQFHEDKNPANPFVLGSVVDLGQSINKAADLAGLKVKSGAEFFITQPIFSEGPAFDFETL